MSITCGFEQTSAKVSLLSPMRTASLGGVGLRLTLLAALALASAAPQPVAPAALPPPRQALTFSLSFGAFKVPAAFPQAAYLKALKKAFPEGGAP